MTADIPTQSRPTPTNSPPGPIAHDLPCIHCSYSLRSLDAAGTCPECGNPVADSIPKDLLRFADRDWIIRLMRGCRIIRISGFTIMGTIFTLNTLPKAAGFFQINHATASLIRNICSQLTWAATGMTAIAFLIGWWLVTTPDSTQPNPRAKLCMATRILGLIAVPLLFLWRAVNAPDSATPLPIAISTFVIAWFAMFLFARHAEAISLRALPPEDVDYQVWRKQLSNLRPITYYAAAIIIVIWLSTILVLNLALPGIAATKGTPTFIASLYAMIATTAFFLGTAMAGTKRMLVPLRYERHMKFLIRVGAIAPDAQQP